MRLIQQLPRRQANEASLVKTLKIKILKRGGGGKPSPARSHVSQSLNIFLTVLHQLSFFDHMFGMRVTDWWRGSQRHTDAGVLEADGQDALVNLVELHQLQQVDEEGHAVVHGVVPPAVVLALRHTITISTHGKMGGAYFSSFLFLHFNSQGSPGNVWSSACSTARGQSTWRAAGSRGSGTS